MKENNVRWIKLISWTAIGIAGLVFLRAIGDLVRIAIISCLLAYIVDPAVVFLESRGLGRTSATAILFIIVFLLIFSLSLIFLPVLAMQITAIQDGMDSGEADAVIARLENAFSERFAFLGMKDLDLRNKAHDLMVSTGDWIMGHLLDLVSVVTNLVLIPFTVFFVLKDGREMKKRIIRMVPNRYFEFSMNVLHKMDLQLGNFLRGQFIDAVIFAILSIFALWLLGVKYFLIIGIFAGMANLIPFLGPIAGAAPAIVVSVLDTGNFQLALYVVIAFSLMKLIDDVLIQPVVVAKSVHMHPLIVLLAVIIGGKFFGILGMLLSVPAAGIIKVAVQESVAGFRRYHLS